jgi:Na+/H+-dicarboxylate symporter
MGGPVQSRSAGPCWKGCRPERVSFQPVENAVAPDDQQTSGDCPSETWRPAQRPQRRLYFRQASGRGGTPHSVRHPQQFESLIRIFVANSCTLFNAPHLDVVSFLLNIIPNTVVDAFAKGEILQVLLFAVLFGLGLSRMGDHGKAVVHFLDETGGALFGVIAIIMRAAPLGAFGATAFTIGRYGIGALAQLGFLMLCFYLTCGLFIFLAIGAVGAPMGLNILKILRFVKEEFLIVLGTSSSEAAMPTLMEKLELLGCGKSLVGLTVPLGYAFNLDGSSIYFTMAIAFIAQALNIPLSLSDYLLILSVLLLTSKGAATVTGGGFITLVAIGPGVRRWRFWPNTGANLAG